MSGCGGCTSCSAGVPVCVGNVCLAPEEVFVQGSFLFATFATLFNFFVARREAVKQNMSGNTRMIIFVAIPVVLLAYCVQIGYVEVPTIKAIENSIYGTNSTKPEPIVGGHNHSHGHAEWHGDHVGHFHHGHGHETHVEM